MSKRKGAGKRTMEQTTLISYGNKGMASAGYRDELEGLSAVVKRHDAEEAAKILELGDIGKKEQFKIGDTPRDRYKKILGKSYDNRKTD